MPLQLHRKQGVGFSCRGQGAPGVLSNRNPAGALAVLDDVALVLHLCTLGQKTLATLGATTGEDGATVLGSHAGAETELALAAALGRLVCSLAHNILVCLKWFL